MPDSQDFRRAAAEHSAFVDRAATESRSADWPAELRWPAIVMRTMQSECRLASAPTRLKQNPSRYPDLSSESSSKPAKGDRTTPIGLAATVDPAGYSAD